MYYAKKYGLLPADRLIEPIFQTGLSQHHAIYLGRLNDNIEWVAENHKFQGIRLISAAEYFREGKSFRVVSFIGSDQEREAALQRALQLRGTAYDLVNFNCEHYASFVQWGRLESKQVLNVFVVLVGVALIAVLGSE